MTIPEPNKILVPFADSGLKNSIPANANNTTGKAGFDKGFPERTMLPKASGGIPPSGMDFNGILHDITSAIRYMQAGGKPTYDAAFAAAIGGYPSGAVLIGDDGASVFQNAVAGNQANPNSGGSGWARGDLMLFESLRRSYAEAGYDLIGTFSNTGLDVNTATDVVLWEATGVAYSWAGALPHKIGAGETPVGNPSWVRKDANGLRGDLAAPLGPIDFTRTGLRDFISVKDKQFGAKGDNVANDTLAIQKAIDYVAALGGGTVWVPIGMYKITAKIIIKAGVILRGVSRYVSVIQANSSIIAISFEKGQSSAIEDLKIRSADIGVDNSKGTAYWSQIRNCWIMQNRIGVRLKDAYINTLKGNMISFNGCGVVSDGMGYQINILDNIIDNNTGGCGVLLLGTHGLVIENNTIEGNRKDGVTVNGGTPGVGLFIKGYSQRCKVSGNWFEANGSGNSAVDVMLGQDPNFPYVMDIVNNCIPAEYVSATKWEFIGNADLQANAHIYTKMGYLICHGNVSVGHIKISKASFMGTKGKFNEPVRISLIGTAKYPIVLEDLAVINTGDLTINAEMLKGINNGPVYYSSPTPPPVDMYQLDGVDLFTKVMTATKFLTLPNATLSATARVPASGNASMNNNIRAIQGTSGVNSLPGTGRLRYGAAPIFTVNGERMWLISIATAGSQIGYNHAGGFVALNCCSSSDGDLFNISHLEAPASAEATLYTGAYFGHALLTEAEYITSFNGATRLKISDLEYVTDTTKGIAAPSSTSLSGAVGDIIYNSSPAAGGFMGWVCVAAGSPGTWKTFGPITA